MAAVRWLLVGALLVTAAIIQLTVLPLLRLPGSRRRTSSASPWSALGLAAGPVRGRCGGLRRRTAPRPRAPGRRHPGPERRGARRRRLPGGPPRADQDRSPLVTVGADGAARRRGRAGPGHGRAGSWSTLASPGTACPMLLLTQAAYAAILAPFVVPGVGGAVAPRRPAAAAVRGRSLLAPPSVGCATVPARAGSAARRTPGSLVDVSRCRASPPGTCPACPSSTGGDTCATRPRSRAGDLTCERAVVPAPRGARHPARARCCSRWWAGCSSSRWSPPTSTRSRRPTTGSARSSPRPPAA